MTTVEERISNLLAGSPIYDLENLPAPKYSWMDEQYGNKASHTPIVDLADHANNLIESLGQGDGIKLGLGTIDVLTRGFRPTDLVMVVGFSHQGKTQVTLNLILNNPDKRILFVTLDDPPEMILCKLVAMQIGWTAEHIEEKVRAGDEQTIELVRKCANEVFSNLVLHDERVAVEQLDSLVAEAERKLGGTLDCIIIDYLDLLKGIHVDDEFSGTKKKADAIKGWATHQAFPTICLHQTTRSGGRPGQPITISSMAFSGEQQSTIILGVRRKKDDLSLEWQERQAENDTVTLHIVKNKRPGGRLTPYGGITFHMDQDTGRISVRRASYVQPSEGYSNNNYQP